MPDLKFDSFIYDKDGSTHFLDEIKNDDIYFSIYYEHMLCPECKTAKVTRSHSKNGKLHIKTSQNSKHGMVNDKPCYLSQPPAPQYAINEHLNNLRNSHNLQNKLKTIIRILKRRDFFQIINTHNESSSDALSLTYISKTKTIKKNAVIPKYSINQWYYIPENEIVAIYGKVKIEVRIIPNNNNTGVNKYWRFYNEKTGKMITSMWANKYPEDITDGIYYFATFGKKEQYKSFYNLVPFDASEGISVEKIE